MQPTENSTEEKIENELIKDLKQIGYTRIDKDTNLKDNFKVQIEKLNKKSLTDSEFNILYKKLMSKSFLEKSRIIRDGFSIKQKTGHIDLKFINKDWCKNIFQVMNQYSQEKNGLTSRYDVTILINGIPMIQIELKNKGLGLKKAIGQIERYKKEAFTGLYSFLQLFVVSDKVNTKYFSNNISNNREFIFTWGDKENNKINKLEEFSKTFLKPCNITKFISNYMVIGLEDIKIFRPYQYYAAEEILSKTKNGYVWHTTGSGKTLTSFKTAELLSKDPSIKKVIFTVDRLDLDYQTVEEFKKFANGNIDIGNTPNTYSLIRQLKDNNKKLIITTIQKLDKAMKNNSADISFLKNEKVVFIFDECHRTQFGKINREIQNFFTNHRLIGFTGTPILEENAIDKTTADIFQKCYHKYLIKDAIADKNVLPFLIEYYETSKEDKIVKDKYKKVVKAINEFHEKKTFNMTHNAIFATENINEAISYKKEFDKNSKLKTAIVFSVNENEDFERRSLLSDFISGYNKLYNTNFTINDQPKYKTDIAKRMKRLEVVGEVGKEKQAEIDILIVVDMFLTGFDSKITNTLYIDKYVKNHTLLQAFSRTNRLYEHRKREGNIISFVNLREETEKAIQLFSEGDSEAVIIMKENYIKHKKEIEENVALLKTIAPLPEDIDKMVSEEEQKEFVKVFKTIIGLERRMGLYIEYKDEDLAIDKNLLLDYKSKYIGLYRKREQDKSDLQEIDFEIELMDVFKVNVDYILGLIERYSESDNDIDKEEIRDQIIKEASSDLELIDKLDIFIEFIENMDNISKENIKERFYIYLEEKEVLEIKETAEKNGIPEDFFKYIIREKREFDKEDKLDIADKIIIPSDIKNEREYIKGKIKDITEERDFLIRKYQ